MGINRYAAEMAVKAELKELIEYIDDNEDYFNDDSGSGYIVADIRREIQRRIKEPTEG
ncbi:hypothetical protein LCGC14_0209470 [marine sediment metagenome]|uniref:Uncharacterized protein n=1 Tax=marine sediment metagenome TaxID=412755 RepID=A0A0F9X120_9ZZZZ